MNSSPRVAAAVDIPLPHGKGFPSVDSGSCTSSSVSLDETNWTNCLLEKPIAAICPEPKGEVIVRSWALAAAAAVGWWPTRPPYLDSARRILIEVLSCRPVTRSAEANLCRAGSSFLRSTTLHRCFSESSLWPVDICHRYL